MAHQGRWRGSLGKTATDERDPSARWDGWDNFRDTTDFRYLRGDQITSGAETGSALLQGARGPSERARFQDAVAALANLETSEAPAALLSYWQRVGHRLATRSDREFLRRYVASALWSQGERSRQRERAKRRLDARAATSVCPQRGRSIQA